MIYEPGAEPSLPNGSSDNTHYNIYGATTVAKLLSEALFRFYIFNNSNIILL